MKSKFAFILLALLIATAPNTLAHSKQSSLQGNTAAIVALWNNANSNPYNIYPVAIWEEMFEKAYKESLEKKETSSIYKTRLALAYIYHDQAKFKQAFPLLKSILEEKQPLTELDTKRVLVKIEEEYRNFTDIINAIRIRNIRIKRGDINTYWEIYRDCALHEAAKRDFLQFQNIPPLYSERRLFLYQFLGDIYFDLQQYDSARIIWSKAANEARAAIAINKKTKASREEDLVYYYGCLIGNLGKCDVEEGKYNKAIPKLLFDIKTSHENIGNKISKMLYVSESYIHLGKNKLAKHYLDSSAILIKGKTMKWIHLYFLKTNANYFKAVKQKDSAIYYLNAYSNYKDSLADNIQKNQSVIILANLEVNNRRAELSDATKSLAEKDKKVNLQQNLLYSLVVIFLLVIAFTILLYRNYRQKNKNKTFIEKQNERNEVLLKELHHRVKNNLQVMYSLLNLQKRRNEEEDIKSLLSSVQNRIQTMALVHQNLYTTGDFEMVDIASYVKTLATHLQSIYQIDNKNVKITFDIEALVKISLEKVVSIGLIINEAVSNSFKYAFNEQKQGELFIRIRSDENKFIIEISDNGPGFCNQQIKENSLGMKLINVMCTQLAAQYTLTQKNGVTHLIEFYK
jgi:two-component sensor histidine kinase